MNWGFSAEVENPIHIKFFDDCYDKKEGTIRHNFKSDSGEDYVPVFKISAYEAIDLVTISFNANGGTGTMDTVVMLAGEFTLPANGFTAPSGQTFNGWRVGNLGATLAAGSKINVTADITLYAQWRGSSGDTGTGGGGTAGSSISPSRSSYDASKGGDLVITLTASPSNNTLLALKDGSSTLKEGTDYTVSGKTITI
jgi:uncharacterized repeat protein (TIGR02543 family)